MRQFDGDCVSAKLGLMRSVHSLLRRVIACISALAAMGVGLAACGSSPPTPIAVQSPVATTLSWFRAVNAHDMPTAQAHFAPGSRDMMNWSQWGPPFTQLHCALQTASTTVAVVHCSFAPITDADTGMDNESFWNVYLQREPSGLWLINNYGQG